LAETWQNPSPREWPQNPRQIGTTEMVPLAGLEPAWRCHLILSQVAGVDISWDFCKPGEIGALRINVWLADCKPKALNY
jgi:hypothetical protein